MFRNEVGRLLGPSSLFLEPKYGAVAIYTLSLVDKTYHNKVYPSLYRLYIQESDVTEYNFANKYFESFQHWQEICEDGGFKPYILKWRRELELKIKAEALKEIIAQAASDDPRKRLEASKYIYEKVFVGSAPARGRPSKQQVKDEAQRLAQEQNLVKEDWNRLVN